MTKIYTVFDVETTYGEYLGRAGSPFSQGEITLCASGFLHSDGEYESTYLVEDVLDLGHRSGVVPGTLGWLDSFPNLAGVDVLVGHNIKFDLLWYWRHPELERFLKNGGVIWDTAYAEYLLSGQFYHLAQLPHLRPSLANCAKRRGLTHKLDVVAAMWDQGIRTEDIPEDVLMEYLHGDCITTNELYLQQIAQAERQYQTHMIEGRMEGLLATTEMEYNGLCIDLNEAAVQQEILEDQIDELREQLQAYVPAMPAELEFNWGSTTHLSALLFGGKLKYKAKAEIKDENGDLVYYQAKVDAAVLDANGNQVYYVSGKNKGKPKTRKMTVPDLDRGPKMRYETFYHELPGLTKPLAKWKSSVEGRWSTGAEVLEELGKRDLPMVADLLLLKGAEKDLGTYYKRLYKGRWTGMLTMVDPKGFIHHNLNHAITTTTRLSSNKPNLQNLPGKGKSNVRKLFISRFGDDGLVAEGDYSQLEVVCKAVLAGDTNLLRALQNGVCFHCDWLSLSPAGEGKSYEEIHDLCKIQHDPIWVAKRKKIKPLTFGEAYGAGVSSLSESTGMTAEDVESAIAARKRKYPALYAFDEANIEAVKTSRRPSQLQTALGMQAGIGYLRSVTDTIFHFVEGDAPDWMQHRGQMTSFSPTTIKNYPGQGLGGEIMQVTAGRLFRWLLENNRFGDMILLINTVHDSAWLDIHKSMIGHLPTAKAIMEDVSPWFNDHYPSVDWDAEFPVDMAIGPNFMALEDYDEMHPLWEDFGREDGV